MFPITNGVPEADLLDELAVLDPHPAISKATSASSTESFVLFLRCKRRHVFGVANFASSPFTCDRYGFDGSYPVLGWNFSRRISRVLLAARERATLK